MKKETQRFIWEWFVNLTVACWYGRFAYLHTMAFLMQGRLSSLFFVIFETTIIALLLLRRMPKSVSLSVYDWAVALLGTLMPLLLLPVPESTEMFSAHVVQIVGISISIAGLMSLNRSYGVVAASRGIKTNGLYRFVRHPIYMGYFISLAAFAAQNLTVYNIMVVVAGLFFQVLRIFSEEKFLSKDPAYVEFMKKTRFRLIPFVW